MKELIESLKETREEMIKAISHCTITSTPFIVMCAGVAVSPEVINGKSTGKIESGDPHTVRRFSKVNAKMIAKGVKNGYGDKGEAVSWFKATEDAIKSIEETINIMEAR